jgi:hypothetical protein
MGRRGNGIPLSLDDGGDITSVVRMREHQRDDDDHGGRLRDLEIAHVSLYGRVGDIARTLNWWGKLLAAGIIAVLTAVLAVLTMLIVRR